MTSFFSDLEDQLRAAARERTSQGHAPGDATRRAPRRRERRGWLARGARALPVAVAVAVTLAVVGGALVLLGHHGGPSPSASASGTAENALATLVSKTPPTQLRRELRLLGAATRKVLASPACRVTQPRTTPQIHAAPGRALLSTLGVLRRPATAADRLPAHSSSTMGPGLAVYAGATRHAATIGGTSYYIVPVRQDEAGAFPSARCFALQKAALIRALPTLPAALRSDVRELQSAFIAFATRLAAKPPVDGICEVTAQRNGGGMACSDTADQIQHGLFPEEDNGTFTGLVPDGVATVTLSFSAAPDRRARSVTATVHGNVYAVETGFSGPVKPGSPRVTWRGADGHLMRTYTEPAQTSARQICRKYPESCVLALALAGPLQKVSESSSSSSASATATVRSRPSPRPAKRSG